jgi:hypothetical protein
MDNTMIIAGVAVFSAILIIILLMYNKKKKDYDESRITNAYSNENNRYDMRSNLTKNSPRILKDVPPQYELIGPFGGQGANYAQQPPEDIPTVNWPAPAWLPVPVSPVSTGPTWVPY